MLFQVFIDQKQENCTITEQQDADIEAFLEQGYITILLARDDKLIGAFALADEAKPGETLALAVQPH